MSKIKIKMLRDLKTPWAYTLKHRTRAGCTMANYNMVKAQWQATGCRIAHGSLEYDKQSRLHEHGIMYIPVKLNRKQHIMKSGYVVHLVPIYTKADYDYWKGYCLKDQDMMYDTNDNEFMKKLKKLFPPRNTKTPILLRKRPPLPRGAGGVPLTDPNYTWFNPAYIYKTIRQAE